MSSMRKLEPPAWFRLDRQGRILSSAYSVDEARTRFLDLVVQLKPAVLDELGAKAASLTEEAARANPGEIEAFISTWARKHHLDNAWSRDWALTQMQLYWG